MLIKYVMGSLAFFNQSWKTKPLTPSDFWDNVDPAPNRPEPYEYYYYHDAAAYDDAAA